MSVFQYGFRGPSSTPSHVVKGQEWYQEDTVAEAYEEKRFSGGGRLIDRREKEAVLDSITPMEDADVLEIACGTGRFSVMLAERGANVTGLDISGPMLARAREKARAVAVGDSVEFMRGDAGRLPFPNDSFDVVFAIRFFHLADTPAAFLSEMRRVARDRIVFDTFNARSARTAYNWLLPMGSRLYTRRDVECMLANVDLDLVDEDHDFVVPYGLYRKLPGSVANPIRRLDTTMIGTPIGRYLASVSYWTARVD